MIDPDAPLVDTLVDGFFSVFQAVATAVLRHGPIALLIAGFALVGLVEAFADWYVNGGWLYYLMGVGP